MIKSVNTHEDNSKIVEVLKASAKDMPKQTGNIIDTNRLKVVFSNLKTGNIIDTTLDRLKVVFTNLKKGTVTSTIRNNSIDLEQLRLNHTGRDIERMLGISRGLLLHALKSKQPKNISKLKEILSTVKPENNFNDSIIYWKAKSRSIRTILNLNL